MFLEEGQQLLESLSMLEEDKNISTELYGKLPWQEVQSSHIKKVAFDRKNQKLYVEFKNRIKEQGQFETVVYRYDNFSANDYRALMNAPSKGQYLHQYVRNQRPFIRLWVTQKPERYKVHIFKRK